MVDFVRLAATAQRLITANGRSVTFVGFNSTLQDTARPWLGATDPRVTPDATLTINGTFVQPDSTTTLGLSFISEDLIKNSEQIMIVSPGEVDLEDFQEVIDSTTRWKIMGVEVLKPGTVTVLAFVGLKR